MVKPLLYRILRINLVSFISLILGLSFFIPMPLFAAGIPTAQLHTPMGAGSATNQGDYVSSSGGLNTYYSYFIEVPPSLSQMVLRAYDTNVGGTIDRARGPWNTSVTYRLFRPNGTQYGAATCGSGTGGFCNDASWFNLTVPNPAAGHWEFRVDMSTAVTTGNDINSFALRADDGDFTSGGTELNIYAESFVAVGDHSSSTTFQLYPFLTSGCTADSNDFDWDNNGSISFTSPLGTFTQNNPSVSGNNAWLNTPFTGWTSDFSAVEYGVWSSSVNISSGPNYGTFYMGDFSAANPPPTAQPEANTFRIYLPTDGGTAPVKPVLLQTLRHISGPNPPANGSTTRVRVQVEIYNPTPWSITFSASNQVTANVPGSGAVYAGNASVTQGSITSQPAIGGTGNITWNPTTVAAGANPIMTYDVDVTPTAAGQRIPVTGTPASNGTTATYVDETGNTTQARATYTYGPLCELAVTEGSLLPTVATISSFTAFEDNGQLVVEWSTSSEIDTAGFYLFRFDESTGDYIRINNQLLPGLLTSPQGGTYSLIDLGASPDNSYTYVLMEIEGKGKENVYGPFTVQVGGDSAIVTQGSPQRFNPQLLSNCITHKCDVKQKTVSSITKFVDRDETVLYTNKKAASRTKQVQQNVGGDQYSNYTRKAHESIDKEARLKAFKEQRNATKQVRKKRAGNMAKISVIENGLYYVDALKIAELLGVPNEYVRRLIQYNGLAIRNQGKSAAYIPSANNTGLFFYGEGIDSIYTKENIYWLGRGSGLQMKHLEGNGPNTVEYGTFTETLHFEEDKLIVPIITHDPESDYWFWAYIIGDDPSDGSKSFIVQADGVANTPALATLTINLHGFTDTSVNPDHHVVISLNGTIISDNVGNKDRWEGTNAHMLTIEFDQQLLNDGANTVEVTGLLDTGAPYSIFYVDSFDLTYQRLYKAHGNKLLFKGDGNTVITAYGFTDSDILIFNLTDPYKPELIEAITIDGNAGNYRVSLTPSSPDTVYLAIASSAAITELNAWADTPSSLSNKRNKADYLVIAPEELHDAAQSLADYRQSQGLKSMVVMLEDIMDEFNNGISSPKAIRDFLTYAYQNWRKHPRYVVLLGEGTYDYKNNQGFGDNLVPTMMTDTPFGIFPSDNLFTDIDGDHVPEMAIGRLSVLTSDELQDILNKIISFESNTNNRVILLADNPDSAGDFPTDSDDIGALVPSSYMLMKIYLSDYDIDHARQLLLNEINNGAFLLNYIGHAGVDRLAHEGLLRSSDLGSLTNWNRLPIITAMTCSVGQFAIQGYDSLSELLVLKGDGGAIAVWAPTGLAYNSLSKILDEEFFNAAFGNNEAALGDIILKAHEGYNVRGGSTYVIDLYNLQGDPALKMW